MKKDSRVYLAHILECIQKIERFTTDGKSRFLSDVMVRDAVVRNLEVIGEAAYLAWNESPGTMYNVHP